MEYLLSHKCFLHNLLHRHTHQCLHMPHGHKVDHKQLKGIFNMNLVDTKITWLR